jgi:DMSO/TMAO reductase YedYZ molybdopterin-dependent catalytic subunit
MSEVAQQRVQRVPSDWPVVHLEGETPSWDGLVVDGLVRTGGRLDLAALAGLGVERRAIPLHCVWGWSRPDAEWEGVTLSTVLDAAGVEGGTHVTVASASGTYSSCMPLADAARGMLAWTRDGEVLTPEAGGPLRFVTPPDYWAYKGVKWAARVRVTNRFVPGFWEARVADPLGRIPGHVELP